MDLTPVINAVLAQLPHNALAWITATIAIASVIASRLPAPALGATGWYPILYGMLNLVAVNVGHARNAAGQIDAGAAIAGVLLNATLAPAAKAPAAPDAAPVAPAAPAPAAAQAVRAGGITLQQPAVFQSPLSGDIAVLAGGQTLTLNTGTLPPIG